jgi:hypothetical protein
LQRAKAPDAVAVGVARDVRAAAALDGAGVAAAVSYKQLRADRRLAAAALGKAGRLILCGMMVAAKNGARLLVGNPRLAVALC